MSPRAARQLERLGFEPVYDYVAGKTDRLSYRLPHERSPVLAADLARRELPAGGPDEEVTAVRARMHGAGLCVVVNEEHDVWGSCTPVPRPSSTKAESKR